MTETAASPDLSALSFEDALARLEDIVRRLESGEIKLEDAVQAYSQGVALKAHCEDKLKEAKAKVEKITLGPNGVTGAEPLDTE